MASSTLLLIALGMGPQVEQAPRKKVPVPAQAVNSETVAACRLRYEPSWQAEREVCSANSAVSYSLRQCSPTGSQAEEVRMSIKQIRLSATEGCKLWLGTNQKTVEDSELNRPGYVLVDEYLGLLVNPPVPNEPVIGVALLPAGHNLIAAFVPGRANESNTPVGWCAAVNRVGAFFCGGFQLFWRELPSNRPFKKLLVAKDFEEGLSKFVWGGTPQARRLIILHELAHVFHPPGEVADAGRQRSVELNNSLVMHYCGDAVWGR